MYMVIAKVVSHNKGWLEIYKSEACPLMYCFRGYAGTDQSDLGNTALEILNSTEYDIIESGYDKDQPIMTGNRTWL